MKRALPLLIALVSSAVASLPADAQDTGRLKKALIGQRAVATSERSKTCVGTLKQDA